MNNFQSLKADIEHVFLMMLTLYTIKLHVNEYKINSST